RRSVRAAVPRARPHPRLGEARAAHQLEPRFHQRRDAKPPYFRRAFQRCVTFIEGRGLIVEPMLHVTKPSLARPGDRRSLYRGLSRRRLIQSFGSLGLSGFATASYGVGIEPESLLVRRYRLAPPRWPAGRRLSINVIADLHAGGPNMTERHIEHVVDVANLEPADLVLLLGDYFATHRFVTEHVPHPIWAAALARLKSRLGTWAVFGNHDWWFDIAGTRAALTKAAIP